MSQEDDIELSGRFSDGGKNIAALLDSTQGEVEQQAFNVLNEMDTLLNNIRESFSASEEVITAIEQTCEMYDNLIRDVHEVVSMNVKGPLTEDSGSRCRQIMCKSEDVMKVRERNDSYLTSLARIIQDVLNEAEKANRVSHKLEESVAKQRKLISKLTQ